ncbi:hypothetical protein F5Y18DRAFT_424150 [Xylariaceae sp. FL1019]|nr:hypothetical protein F5Y18DRAFT_424150 [Xylariaceae sp. FL1019]
MKTRSQAKQTGNAQKPVDKVAHEKANGIVLPNRQYQCDICKKKMSNTSHSISSHISNHHSAGPEMSAYEKMHEGGETICPYCKAVLDCPQRLITHAKNEHNKKMSAPEARTHCPDLN